MDPSLQQIWDGAKDSPFTPVIGKDYQFAVGFSLLALGILLTGLFGLNRKLSNLAILGVPASLSIGFGAVYMICAVGVYV